MFRRSQSAQVRRRPLFAAVLFVIVPLSLGGPAAVAQAPTPAPDEPPNVAEELVRLNRTLTRIAEALESQSEGQRLDLSLRRLAVESERVATLEQELRSAESSLTGLENERFQMQSQFLMMTQGAEAEVAEASPEELLQIERMTAQAERMMERIEGQIRTQDQRVLQIRNELTRRRADLQSLQDRLDRQLDGM